MSLLRRIRAADVVEQAPESDPPAPPADPPAPPADPAAPPASATDEDVAQRAETRPVPRTRTGAAWVGVCAAAVIAVALIVFMVQNTRSVEISFLWMAASTSLAVALLIAAVGGILLTLVVGTARITQLRRVVRRNRR